LEEWEILISTCSNVMNQFFLSVRRGDDIDNHSSLFPSSQSALQIILQIVTDTTLQNEPEHQFHVQILSKLLEGFVANQREVTTVPAAPAGAAGASLVETIVQISKSNQHCTQKFLENLENLIEILCRQVLPLAMQSSAGDSPLFNKLSLFLCGPGKKDEENENEGDEESCDVITQTVVSLCHNLIQSFASSEHFKVTFTFRLLRNLCESYCEHFLKLPMRDSQETKNSHTQIHCCSGLGPLEKLLGKLVDVFLTHSGVSTMRGRDRDSLYRLIGDIYLMTKCQQSQLQVIPERSFTNKPSSALDKHLATLAFPHQPTSSLGDGWLHFLTIFLECNGKSFSSPAAAATAGGRGGDGGRYLSLSSITLVVGNLMNLIQSSSSPVSVSGPIDIASVQNLLQILISVVPPHLRERLVALPLMKMLSFHFPIKTSDDSHFIFGMIETLLRIGFCDWRDSHPNSEFGSNYKKFMIENACWYCERMSTSLRDDDAVSGDVAADADAVFLDHVSLASQLYQLQLKSLSASRYHKFEKLNYDEEGGGGSTGRQFEGTLSALLYNSVISFLSLTTSRLFSFQDSDESHSRFISTMIALIHLLLDVLSSSHFPLLNSNAGSLVIMIRHLIVIGIKSLSSSPSPPRSSHSSSHSSSNSNPKLRLINEKNVFSIDILRLLGRVLMALSSNKHLQRHAHLFVACTVEALSGYATIQAQQKQRHLKNYLNSNSRSSNPAEGAESLTISSHDETLREHLFPGVFALLDRYNPTP
jgi:hypothetical protein